MKVNYNEFKNAVRELKTCEQGWNVYVDLSDGEVKVKHNSNAGENWLLLIFGHNVNSDFDASDENIYGVYPFEYIENIVNNATCGMMEVSQ